MGEEIITTTGQIKDPNKNPLPIDGLNNLLENGFSTSVYLYVENFETVPSFLTNENSKDTLKYFPVRR